MVVVEGKKRGKGENGKMGVCGKVKVVVRYGKGYVVGGGVVNAHVSRYR